MEEAQAQLVVREEERRGGTVRGRLVCWRRPRHS
jgi:hypothetical protein